MDNDTLGRHNVPASGRNKGVAAVFDATVFGLDPAKCGAGNQAALQTVLDAACCVGSGTIDIPEGTYTVSGGVLVAPPSSSAVMITGSGGRTKLVQTNEGSSILILGSQDETSAAGGIVIKGLSMIQGSLLASEATAKRETAGPVFFLGTVDRLGASDLH